ncbi:spindle and kinetochore-associated protein 3 isoform X3 [Falco biarmicus]|uniref:spindle and kinetochore-associated protein 3 isoform X3 n=1 Tax=Falco biarmicus TaxID=345155 RepID=UPI0024BCB090|nr:spindle and kinetochore-associated protein 3 isoform X3 [Falco biarmicus]
MCRGSSSASCAPSPRRWRRRRSSWGGPCARRARPFFCSKPFYVNMRIKDYEDESPVRLFNDLCCEIETLKEDVNASLNKSCSEKQTIHEFMKASEILMERNAADLEKIRELFQKYSYKTCLEDSTGEEEVVNSDSPVSVQKESGEEKADDVPHLPACTVTSMVPEDPLQTPQLSDFGLSQYAFSKPWIALKEQHATSAHQENSKNRTPLKPLTTYVLPKTPKCMLKMDDYECVTPKLEHFGISKHTTCMNEDYTMSLIRKIPQTSKKLFEEDDLKVNVPEIISREIMVTPRPKSNVTAENAAGWMASPMMLEFCTPDVQICSRKNTIVSARSPKTNKLSPPSHTGTPELPDFETRWLKTEAKVKQGGKNESVTKDDTTDKQHIEDSIPFLVTSDEYLKDFEDPSPPKIKNYDDQLLSTPPSPEITRIPDDILQILSKYNKKVDSPKAKEMETKAANATRSESDFSNDCHKENRGYPGYVKPNT